MSHLPPSIIQTALTTKLAKTVKTSSLKVTTSVKNCSSQFLLSSAVLSTGNKKIFDNPAPKKRRKRKNPQAVLATEDCDSDDSYQMSCSDVESFQGKIVYNPDGSAYIIDSENDSFSNVSDNCISVETSIGNATASPAIGAAITPTATNPNPKIHSFRVVTANHASVNISGEPNRSSKIQKPILMCFICKLSFGNTKSFTLHANSEHALDLQESEKQLLNREYSSAIIQRNVDEKPQVSFLEPLETFPLSMPMTALKDTVAAATINKDFVPMDTTIVDATTNLGMIEKCKTSVAAPLSTEGSDSGGNIKDIMSSNSTDEKQNISSAMQENQQHIVSLDLVPSSPLAISMPATRLSPKSTSCMTTTTKTSTTINYGSLKIATTKSATTTSTMAAAAATTPIAAAELSSPSQLVAGKTALCVSGNKATSPSNSTDNLSSIYNIKHQITPIPIPSTTPTYTSTTISCNSASQSPQSPQSSAAATTTAPAAAHSVVDYLQQQLQQHMQRITSPAAIALSPLAVASSLASNECNVPDKTMSTNADMLQQQQQQQQQLPPPSPLTQHNSLSSLHASFAALANEQTCSNAKIINEFLQQQLAAQQQHQQQHQQHHNQQHQQDLSSPMLSGCCAEHPDSKGIDCKSCELSEIPQLKSPLTPQRSPNSSMSGSILHATNTLTTSPITFVAGNLSMTPTTVASTSASSFTIGACPEHINGRPLGMDCARCEMLLNSARLNSGVQMSTRNSCKTLKCPQCNWHYKYQETLEIHMREKHPDGESACGYCLAGQQHPRLARGESYTCGYKPYRCEICNYSTTTKGNLSIHMQSDKHLNNMQELNSTQNMAAAAAVAAAVTSNSQAADMSPKLIMANNMTAPTQSTQQQQQQQHQSSATSSSNSSNASAANKPKPTFRCDVCSYETSVARNLRIHMTSEKHTHNMAVLQNNIKHIQAFSFLQQQQAVAAAQQQQQQQAATHQQHVNPLTTAAVLPQLPAALTNSFLPEAALADLAYNQALMIQLLHQKTAAGALSAAASVSHQQSKQQHTSKTHVQTSPASPTQTTQTLGSYNQPRPTSHSPNNSPSAADSNLVELTLSAVATAAAGSGGAFSQDTLDPSIEPDLRPTTYFSCLVCAAYNTNSLDELNQHLLIDRSRQHMASNSSEIMLILNNNYVCRLCNYKTNLKANFQLHSKTDKHLQKLNFINHIREGGMRNENKLKYHQMSNNTVQLKCNCCDFYTNSIQKLSLHTQHMRHDTMKIIFQHLIYLMNQSGDGIMVDKKSSGSNIVADVADAQSEQFKDNTTNRAFLCQLCNYSSPNILEMVQHVQSLRHIQVEQFVGLQRRSEGLASLNLEDVFKTCEGSIAAHVDCVKSERASPEHIPIVNDSYSSSACPVGRSTHDESNSMMNLDNYFFNTPGGESLMSKLNLATMGCTGTDSTMSALPSSSCLPSVIFKCRNCDTFSQSKDEMEHHLEEMHPNSTELDFISVPTNAAAIHAFQAAIVAATAAAAASASACEQKSSTQKSLFSDDEDDCPVTIKRERLSDEHADIDQENNSTVIQMEAQVQLAAEREVVIGGNSTTEVEATSVQCPLCQDSFTESQILESHLMGVHSVSRDGLARLLQLVDTSKCQNIAKRPITTVAAAKPPHSYDGVTEMPTIESSHSESNATSTSQDTSCSFMTSAVLPTGIDGTELNCSHCGSGFRLQQQLLMHAQETQHYPMQQEEYQCLLSKQCSQLFPNISAMVSHYKDTHMNLVISERHVYKYRCKQCSLAFKTQEKLATHMVYHSMRDATKCCLCQRNFRSTQSLQKHMDQVHNISQAQQQLPSQPLKENTAPLQHAGCKSPAASPNVNRSLCNIADPTTDKAKSIARDEATNPLDSAHKFSSESSPAMSPAMDTKESPVHSNTSETAPPSPAMSIPHHQQHIAAIAALIKQQQLRSASTTELPSPDSAMHQLQMEPTLLAQKIMEQNLQQAAVHFPNLTSQNLQSLQNLQNLQQVQQQLPQMASAAAASGISMNPVDMLNLMQFHHLMSLNFMNLAPPLIFGGPHNATGSTTASGTLGPSAAPASHVNATLCPNDTIATNVAGSHTISTSVSAATGLTSETTAKHLQQQASPATSAAATQICSNQKRARTRITDEQLKILRAHFDINNSPSEESIMEMSKKANLPMKVVKHWFRNTLFKERQRNKDSPYNFNNPPSTTLNLEEYERTGQTKVTSLSETNCDSGNYNTSLPTANLSGANNGKCSSLQQQQQNQNPRPDSAHSNNASDFLSNTGHLNFSQQQHETQRQFNERPRSHASSVASGSCPLDAQIKSEPSDDTSPNFDNDQQQQLQQHQQQEQQILKPTSAVLLKHHQQLTAIAAAAAASDQHQVATELNELSIIHAGAAASAVAAVVSAHQHHHQHNFYNSYETKSESGSSDVLSRPQTPNSASATHSYPSMSDLLGQQLENLPLNNMSNMNNMGPPKKFQMSKTFEKNSPSSQFETNSNSSNSSSTSSGKRANRTRFTDYQIKVLQEFFENNSYPKDSDLEYLSKLLLLSPRVIVVWFQNARQKQRKIYENQPNNSFYETEEKKQNINYACKKCKLVFQRYYELIRHQKNHCFKEENNKKSAKAQIAAAQIAQSLSSEDSNSSMDINNSTGSASLLVGHHQPQHAAIVAAAALATGATTSGLSPSPSLNLLGTSPKHHLFGKTTSSSGGGGGGGGGTSGCMTIDCSPSTSPTPPQRERSSSIDHQQTMKLECEKCQLTFSRFDQLREHQVIHFMNPNLFGASGGQQQQQQQQGIHTAAQQQRSMLPEGIADYSPFGGILRSLQQAAVNQQHQQQQQQDERSTGLSRIQDAKTVQQQKKRKFLDASSHSDEILCDTETQINKKFKSEQYDFLYQYYMQHETNMELKQAIQAQQQQHHSPELELEYLNNFYQQNEIEKRSNYDFLFQYYLRNEQQQQAPPATFDSTNKPNIDFLIQYYQLSESKKFFQLDASPQRIYDCNKTTSTHVENVDTDYHSNSSGSVCGNSHVHENVAAVSNSNKYSKIVVGASAQADKGVEDANSFDEVEGDYPMEQQQQNNFNARLNQRTCHQDRSHCGDDIDEEYSTEIGGMSDNDSADHRNNNNINNDQQFGREVDQYLKQNEIDDAEKQNTVPKTTPPPTITEERQSSHQSSTPPITLEGNSNNQFPPLNQTKNFNNLDDFLDATTLLDNQSHTLAYNEAATSGDVIANAPAAIKASAPNLNLVQQHTTTAEHKQNKRLRTTILPEQLNFLYECYQNESNPSRKMLEEISKKVNLKKRVVQVWYQNSRARERKGQFRQNLQIINKRCPYCTAIFKIKSALEWHLQSKHDDMPKISLEQIADIKVVPDEQRVDDSHEEDDMKKQHATTAIMWRQLKLQQQQKIQRPLDLTIAQQWPQPKVLATTLSKSGCMQTKFSKCSHTHAGVEQQQVKFVDKNEQNMLGGLQQAKFLDKNYQNSGTATFLGTNMEHAGKELQKATADSKVREIQNVSRIFKEAKCSTVTAALISTSSSSSNVSSSSASVSSSSSTTTSSSSSHFLSLTSAQQSSSPSFTVLPPNNFSLPLSLEPSVGEGPLITSTTQQQKVKERKCFRTEMSQKQVCILRALFEDVKAPTIRDYLSIGREIGLQKRVIQVWFQNSRAKDKKSRHQRYVSEDSNCDDKMHDSAQAGVKNVIELRDCQLCQLQQVNIHQHAFSAEHIGRVKALLERTQQIKSINQKYSNGNCSGGSDSLDDQQENLDENEENNHLQRHKNFTKISTPPNCIENNGDTGLVHSGFKSNNNQDQSLLIYDKNNSEVSNGGGRGVVNTSNSHILENNLTLKINSADNQLNADVANNIHANDIIQQLFNCNQISEKVVFKA